MRPFLVAALAACVLVPSAAQANALDEFGDGARAEGMAGTQAADARGHAATYHNPANIALTDDKEAAIGYGGAVTQLSLDHRDAHLTPARGITVGLAIPVKLGSWTIALGVSLYLPDQFIARIQLVPATEPHFALLDNNLQHVVVTAALAIKMGRHFAVGAGASVLADAAGNGISFDVGVVGGEKVGRAALDVALPIRAAPVLGLTLLPTRWLRLAAAWRGALDLGLQLDILANVNIAGVITGDTLIALKALNFYTPHRVALGVAADVVKDVTVSAEVDWLGWSQFKGAIPDLRVLVALGISPPLVQALLPEPRFRDVWVPHIGLEARHDLHPKVGFAARVGYAFQRSPVPPQTGLTSFADNDRHIVSVGAGLELRRLTSILPRPLRFDVALQLHELVDRTTVKDGRLFPGAGFSSGGYLLHLSATLEARF